MGSMTMEEIYRDRKKFSEVVFEVATSDLVNMGITVVSYTLKDIQDEDGYLKALGLVRTAEVKKDARIGEAEARRDDDDDDNDNDNDDAGMHRSKWPLEGRSG